MCNTFHLSILSFVDEPGFMIGSAPEKAATGALPVEGGVAVAFAREIAAADDPGALRAELEARLAAGQLPFPRAEGFSVHELIDPRETRAKLCDWLDWIGPRRTIARGPYMTTMRP